MNPETQSSAPVDVSAREEIEEKINNARTKEERKSLLVAILKRIQQMVVSAREAVDEANKANSGTVLDKDKDKKKDVGAPIIQLVQFLQKITSGAMNQEVLNEVIQEEGLTDTQHAFLQAIAEHEQSADSGTFLGNIVGSSLRNADYLRVSKQGEQKTQLEQDYEKIKGNATASTSFQKAMVRLARDGKLLDREGNQLNENDTRQRFGNPDEEEATQPHSEARQRPLSERGRELEESLNEYVEHIQNMSRSEREMLNKELQEKEQERLNIRHNTSLSDDDKERQGDLVATQIAAIKNQITQLQQQQEAVDRYIRTGEIIGHFAEEDNPDQAIRNFIHDKMGLADRDIRRYREMWEEAGQSSEWLRGDRYGAYSDLISDMSEVLSSNKLYDRIWDKEVHDINYEGLRELEAELEDYVSRLFAPLYDSPKSEFNQVFTPYVEGQILRQITSRLRAGIEDVTKRITTDLESTYGVSRAKAEQVSRGVRDTILKERLVAEIERRQAIEQIVHRYQQMGSQIEIEELQKILKTYDITTLQEFYKDELTLVVSDLLPQFTQQLFTEQGNEVITNLFQIVQEEQSIQTTFREGAEPKRERQFIVKYRDEFVDYAYNIIKELHEEGAIKSLPTRERIRARFSRAYLDNFLLSLRGVKVAGNALPMREKFDDIPYWHIVKGLFNPLHNWGKMGLRGRGAKGVGDAESYDPHVGKFLYDEEGFITKWMPKYGNMYADWNPKEEMAKAKKLILYNIYPDKGQLEKDLESGKWDYFQSMLDVYGQMAFGNIIDQSGWPFKGLNKEKIPQLMKDMTKHFKENEKWDDLSWDKKFDLYYRTAGVVPAFWLVNERAGEEGRNRFIDHLREQQLGRKLNEDERETERARYRSKVGSVKFDSIEEEYTAGSKRFEKIIDVKIDGEAQKVTYRDYIMRRQQSLRGEVFHQLLLKDPHAWLGDMVQRFPELAKGYVNYIDNNGDKQEVKAADFYFDMDRIPDSDISSKDKEARDRFRFQALTLFRGKKEDDYMTHVPHLKCIMNLYTRIQDEYEGERVEGYDEPLKGDEAKKYGMRQMAQRLQFARRKAIANREAEINKEDVKVKRKNANGKGEVLDTRVYDLLYGDGGMVTHFERMVGDKEEYFGNGDDNLGVENGFYQRWGRWEQYRGHILPEGDTNMDLLTEKIENKQALDRRLVTDIAMVKAQEVMDGLPGTFNEAGDAKTFDEWYGIIEEKIHKPLKVIAEELQDIEQKYQYDAFTAVINRFFTDARARQMFLGPLQELNLGKDIAVSTIKADYKGQYILTYDAIHTYIRKLRAKRYLKIGYNILGGFGEDTAIQATGASLQSIIARQIPYALIGTGVLIAITAIKEAYEEEVEEE